MTTLGLLVVAIGSLGLGASQAKAAEPAYLGHNRGCRNVKTEKITGSSVEVSPRFGCSGARKVVRKYFELVVATGQTVGGCAQERSTKGCKVDRYRCFTKYVHLANELEGECRGPKGVVWFVEADRGPN